MVAREADAVVQANILAVCDLDDLALAREAHACTHTTFSPNIAHGGTKVNVIPDRVDIDVDIRSLPGIESHEVEAMIKEALGPLASRVTIETPPDRKRGGSVSPEELGKIVGVDVNDTKFWEGGILLIEEGLKATEEAAAAAGRIPGAAKKSATPPNR